MKNWSRDHIVALLYDYYLLPLLLRRESASSCDLFCDRWQKNGDARFRFFGALHGLYNLAINPAFFAADKMQ
jgi:hypothetical protein